MGARKLTIFAAHTDSIWENKITMRGSVGSCSGEILCPEVSGKQGITLTSQGHVIVDVKRQQTVKLKIELCQGRYWPGT